jgi:hypothetical protein
VLPPAVRLRYLDIKHRIAPVSTLPSIPAFKLRPDESPRRRVTLFINSIRRSSAFGGVLTGLEFFCALAAELRRQGECDVRVVLTRDADVGDTLALGSACRRRGVPLDAVEIVSARTAQALDVRGDDFFVAFDSILVLSVHDLLAQQREFYGVKGRRLVYIMQDYEPGFHAFSVAHALSAEAYSLGDDIFGVVNTSLLKDYFEVRGHRFRRTDCFEPRMNPDLAALARLPRGRTRKHRILVYGRPWIQRNCWPALIEGLRLWARDYPNCRDWTVVSAGDAHLPMQLAPGVKMTSVGKLTLADYGALMLESAVGVSLMASPHPSYPPLEMAHFGMLTITNRFANKDWAQVHDNILPIDSVRPQAISAALSAACAQFEADPAQGDRGQSGMPDYLSDSDEFAFVDDLAAALLTST